MDTPAAVALYGTVEVLEPEIVEAPCAEASAPRKPRRQRVIDVPSSEAA